MAVDIGAVAAAQILNAQDRRIDVELAVVPGNAQVAVGADEPDETVGSTSHQAVGGTAKTVTHALVRSRVHSQSHSLGHGSSHPFMRTPGTPHNIWTACDFLFPNAQS